MSRSGLIGLAVLKVNWDTLGTDYVENFVPLVVECLRVSKGDVVSLQQLQEEIRNSFGLNLPLNPLRQVLRRAARDGYVSAEQKVFRRNQEECEKSSFRETRQKVEAIFTGIVDALCLFAKDRHRIVWTPEDAECALQDFLAEKSVTLLHSLVNGVTFDSARTRNRSRYIVGDFVTDCQRSNHRLLEDVGILAKGNLLANALYVPDIGSIKKRFERTRVYLDTTVLAYAAGFAGPSRAAPCQELIKLLHEYGADLYCFRGTLDELNGILDSCASRIRNHQLRDSYGPSMEYFIEINCSAADIELMAATLPEHLNHLGVKVGEKPPYVKDYQIDEKAFESALEQEIGYHNIRAREHDVDCISAIARLRRGHESYSPETSRALFVTANVALARVTRKFFQPEASPKVVPLCLTDYDLGNLLWLKSPTEAPELPMKRLIADAYAATQPSEDLWKKYLHEISKLEEMGTVTHESYYVLRHSLAARRTLMDLTHGDPEIFAEGTVQEVLQIATESLRADVRRSLEEEAALRRASEERLQSKLDEELARTLRMTKRADWYAHWGCRVIMYLIIACILIALYHEIPGNYLPQIDGVIGWLLLPAVIIFLIVTSIHLLWEIGVVRLFDRLESKVAQKIKNWLVRFHDI
jgi:hypothetical protein